jgi:hypothetical protein
LVYPRGPRGVRGDRDGAVEELVDTGGQRLVGDLDELPHPVLGYQLLEAPSRRRELASQALPANRVRWHRPDQLPGHDLRLQVRLSLLPHPAYNQRQHRLKAPPASPTRCTG